jgi:ribosomal protein L11 methyltransferase
MHELVLRAPEALVEPLSDALMGELDALSVSVEDADADRDDEQALFGEPGLPPPREGWRRSVLRALYADEAQAAAAAALLLAQAWLDGVEIEALQAVPDEDWVRLTQSQFAPVEITPRFWIVPSWHQAPPQATTVIRLDPGLAFGTGTHPTTRMCLRWIATHAAPQAPSWERVLDYGCGSGILAIGAALHGARRIDAVDIDTAAVESSRANALANGVMLNAAPQKLLAPLLCGHVAPGGHLVLAGILQRQAAEMTDAYAPWVALTQVDCEDGWVLMAAHRSA